jgi:endo-1,4-beta-xylanase
MIIKLSEWSKMRIILLWMLAAMLFTSIASAATPVKVVVRATGGDSKIDLSWTVKGDLKYVQVYRDTDANPSGRGRKAILIGSTRHYTDNNVENGRQYWYWIKYTDASGKVGNSDAAIATALSGNSGNDIKSSSTCGNATSTTLPTVFNGVGEYCGVTSGDIDNINSWNTDKVEINGVSYTNGWSNRMPARINGKYYIHYVGKKTWAHLEVNGNGGSSEDSGSTPSVSVSGLSVSPANTTVTVGSSSNLKATVMPSNATNKNVSWRSSATRVALVSGSGVVTGVSAGTATISVTTADGGHRATANVTVLSASAPNDNSGVASLKSMAVFPIGIAVNAGNEKNSIINSTTSSQQQAIVFSHFNQITAGNIMKMSYLHPSENSFTFNQADQFVSFANSNGIAVHGHTLIWHSDYQVPDFMKNYKGDFAAMLKQHVQTIVSHFVGKVVSWDVVNEALADNNESGAVNGFRNSVFYKKMGVNYIDQAFINARAADPVADLFYNDYSIENGDAKTKNLLSLVDGMKARGVPITGVGFQMHVLTDWPSTSTIESAMKAVASRGLKVKISELDVRVNNPYNNAAPVYKSLTAEAAARQKERYRQIVAAYLRAVPPAQRAGITVWGVWDANSWLNTPEHPDWPLLFDDNFQAKPALQGFADGLTRK